MLDGTDGAVDGGFPGNQNDRHVEIAFPDGAKKGQAATARHASAAFPIRTEDGEPFGVLSVYADRREAFREKEVALLREAAADLSFALDVIERERARVHAEEALARLAAIVECTDDAIFATDLDSIITSWNAAAAAMFGYRPEEVIGQRVEILFPPERVDEERMFVARIRLGERVKQFVTERCRKDGTRFTVSMTVSPIWGRGDGSNDKTLVGISKTVRDISEQRLAQASAENEQRFANGLIEAMPGVFYFYDEAGRFLRWNRNFERVSGSAASEVATMAPLDFIVPDDRPVVERAIAAVFENGEATVEAGLLSKDGTATPFFFTGRRVEIEGGCTSHRRRGRHQCANQRGGDGEAK